MTFSFGGGKRGLILFAATALTLSLSLSACSSDDSPSDDPTKATASTEPKADEEAAVKDLTTRYWAAIVKAENGPDADPKQFRDVASGSFIEAELKRLRTYEAGKIRRVGEPEITAIETTVTGNSADIRACVNQDSWAAEKDGEKVPAPGAGPLPWGAEATLTDGVWLITDVRVPAKGSKKCA